MVVATAELRRITKAVFSEAKELLFPKEPFLPSGDFCVSPEDYLIVYGSRAREEKQQSPKTDAKKKTP